MLMSPMTVASALLFDGRIDFERLETALSKVGEVCPWLFCALAVKEVGIVHCVPREADPDEETFANKGYLQCQVEEKAVDYSHDLSLADLLPSDVHIKMTRVDQALESVDGLPISALRVTQFSNHFVIGYRLNHMFFDQNSIVYLLKYLGNVYTNGNATIPCPAFKSREVIVGASEAFECKNVFNCHR